MAGEGRNTPQFSDEAITVAYKSNFLFDEVRRAGAILDLANGSGKPILGTEYMTATDDLELVRRQFNEACAQTGKLLLRESGLNPTAVPNNHQQESGVVFISYSGAFYVSEEILSGRQLG